MTAITSTAYSRDLGDELRLLRETCTGVNGRAFAARLGWDPSKVSTIEHGKARANELDLIQYLTACGKDYDYYDEFKRRYRYAFDLYFAQVPDNLRTLAMTESMATKITVYDIHRITGLLQTKAYAHELFVATGIETPENIKKAVEFRAQRQAIMRRHNRPECVFYIHELALQTRLGDAKLMEEQYLRLLFKTHVLRVVPASDRKTALLSKCTLYEFKKASPVVFSSTDTAKVFAQDTSAVERTRKVFERLDAVALDEEQSRRMLMEYVSELREEPHAPMPDLA
ncbi:helix-turn-helix transcriptional regulator [Lentzea sp. NPDC006480]|uniref:helix-turn-helix domain-containing protein n=1 Tax=Lentzea sp. NPDC006480 TaxID=3157176 RepID=UPI0033BB6C36